MPSKLTIPAGARYGRLTVIEQAPPVPKRRAHWLCRCSCGATLAVDGSNLIWGKSLSCGCLKVDRARGMGNANRTHGFTGTRGEYRSWCGARQRCKNPRDDSYKDYGGRGITVCPEWDDFAVFLRDMGPKPSPAHSLDRIDNDGPYAPWNCRWATPIEQMRNRRITRKLTYLGRTQSLGAWCDELGLAWRDVAHRLKHGWSDERALSTPVVPRTKRL